MNTDKEGKTLEFINSRQKPEDLLELPLTPPQAHALFQYRGKYGHLASLDELLKVRGIGKRTLEKIKDWIPQPRQGGTAVRSGTRALEQHKKELRESGASDKPSAGNGSKGKDVGFTLKQAVWTAIIGYLVLSSLLYALGRISYGWFLGGTVVVEILAVTVLLVALGNLLSGQKKTALALLVVDLGVVVALVAAFDIVPEPGIQNNQPDALLQSPATMTYQILDEETSDVPIKTQVVVKLLVSGEITQEGLKKLLGDFYREIMARRGFKYHESPTNVYIFAYTSKERAESGYLWIAMLDKSYNDSGPKISINERQLALLGQEPEDRFGLTEEQRVAIFREMALAEDRALAEAMAKYPDLIPGTLGYSQEAFRQQLDRQIEEMDRLNEKYKEELATKHGLTREQLDMIATEGLGKDWPFPASP